MFCVVCFYYCYKVEQSVYEFDCINMEENMQIETRLFGEIEIEEEKIIFFEKGIIGFPDCQKFTLIFDENDDGSRK